ncbi:MAG: hypothetical protein R3C10_02740 [Pirellulales bacterium]
MWRSGRHGNRGLRFVAFVLGAWFFATPATALEPTHTITTSSGTTAKFSTGPWSPAAPPVGGDASYVLGLHTDVDAPGTSVIDHDFPATFEAHGMLITSSGTTSDWTMLTGESFLLFNDNDEPAPIEHYGLGLTQFDTKITADASLSIYNPSVGTLQFFEPLDVAVDLTVDGFVYDDLSPSTTAFVDLNQGGNVGGNVEIRGAGLEIRGATLTGANELSIWESTRVQLDMSGLSSSPDLIEDTTPVVLEGGRIEISGAFGGGGAEVINGLTLAAGTSSELELEADGGFFIDTLTQGRGGAALILTRGTNDDVFDFGRTTAPLALGHRPEQIGALDNDNDGDESDASIIPFLIGSSDAGQRLGNTFVTVNNSTGELRLLIRR